MPAGDVIFERLQAATDAELAAIARALDETLGEVRAENIDMLSRELRSDAGSAIANRFRHDHDLPYLEILHDVADKAVHAAGWSKPKLGNASVEQIENYIVRAFSFAERKASFAERKSAVPDDEARKAQAEAERDLGLVPADTGISGSGSGAARAAGIAASYLLRTNPIAVTASFAGAAAFGLVWMLGPAMRRVTPAVLALIHVRFRQTAEAALGGGS
jgi:hypothetical protein